METNNENLESKKWLSNGKKIINEQIQDSINSIGKEKFYEILENISKLNVALVGDVCLDSGRHSVASIYCV